MWNSDTVGPVASIIRLSVRTVSVPIVQTAFSFCPVPVPFVSTAA